MEAHRRFATVVASLLSMAMASGCDGRTVSSPDAGPRPDSGGGGWDAGRQIDAGPVLDTIAWTVSGAQSGTFSYDSERNYVSCVEDGGGFFSLSASVFAGGDEGLSFAFYDYAGPGTYEAGYTTGSGGPSSSVRLIGGYSYWLFYNRSSVDFSMVPSTCTLTVTAAAGSDSRIDGILSCSNFVATISSPDYDDEDTAGFRPSIALSAEFSCEL